MAKVWTLTMNNGLTIPAFGLGTFLSKPGEVGAAVEIAIKAGYRHIDCAHVYGNEAEIGEALQKCFKEGVVKREDIFITSKLWNTEHAREDVVPACQLTLKNLQLDYIDLYLIHSPPQLRKGCNIWDLKPEDFLGYDPDKIAMCWEGMEECVAKGLARSIGISNFSITKIESLLKTAKIVPAANQVENHPYFQQLKLKQYCSSKGIIIEAYGPLGAPARPAIADADPVVMEDPVIKEIAEKHNATPAQICIAYSLRRGLVVIPKSVNPVRIEQNFQGTQVELSDEEMDRIKAIDKNCRLFKGERFLKPGMKWEEAWDTKEDEMFVIKQ